MKSLVYAAVSLLTIVASPSIAGAQAGGKETEELRREIRALRAELQSLRLLLSELAELDRQRANSISRALEGQSTGPVASAHENSGNSSNNNTKPPEPTLVSERTDTKANPGRAQRPPKGAQAAGSVVGRVEVPKGEPVAYVYVENVSGPPVKGEVVIEQSKKQFLPNWAVIQRGTTIKFPNMDNIYHNVFSRSPGNTFDLGLYNSSEDAKAHTFFEAGPVDVYCNIHPRMAASVLVVPNRHFVKVNADGSFSLGDVPAGKRKIVAWAPGSRPASDWVELEANGRAEIALKLESKSGTHTNKEGRPYTSYE